MIMDIFFLILIQYFIVQVIVSRGISGYSFINDLISELGDTKKSPMHNLMNTSFLLNGFLLCLIGLCLQGSLFTRGSFLLSGIGAGLVAFNPENQNGTLHVTGAALSFIFGNISLFSLGHDYMGRTSEGLGSISSKICYFGGSIGLLSLPLFIYSSQHRGLYERLVSSPQSLALIAIGIMHLGHRLKNKID